MKKLSGKEFSKLVYFINFCTYIFQSSCLLLWSTFSSEHTFSDCLLYNEDHSNNPEKYDVKLDRHNNVRKYMCCETGQERCCSSCVHS